MRPRNVRTLSLAATPGPSIDFAAPPTNLSGVFGTRVVFIRRAQIVCLICSGLLMVVGVITQVLLYEFREDWGTAFSNATEAQLYSVPPFIRSLTATGEGDVLATVETEDRGRMSFKTRLKPGISTWTLPLTVSRERLVLEYTPQANYSTANNTHFANGVVAIRDSSMPLESPLVRRMKDWAPLVSSSVQNASPVSPAPSVESVLAHLISQFEGMRGVPGDDIMSADLPSLLQALEQGEKRLWCAQIAMITSGALGKGHVVRLITASGRLPGSRVVTGGHSFNEVLDENSGRWMLVDPTNYIVGMRWQDGIPVSAAEFRKLMSIHSEAVTNGLTINLWDKGQRTIVKRSWIELPRDVRNDLRFYFSANNSLNYFSSRSAIYSPTPSKKLIDWASLDKRFRLAADPGYGAVAYLRVATFWLTLLITPILLLLFVGWARRPRDAATGPKLI
jgi:hypothetical protein